MGVQIQSPFAVGPPLGWRGISSTSSVDEPMPDVSSPRGRVRSREEFESDLQPMEDIIYDIDIKRNKLPSEQPAGENVNCDDTEFASDDWEGRIRRCEERINTAVYKDIWKQKLERLKEARDRQR